MGTEFAYLLEQYIGNRTQAEICEAVGIDPATLSRAKTEGDRLGRNSAVALAEELELTGDEFEEFVLIAQDIWTPI